MSPELQHRIWRSLRWWFCYLLPVTQLEVIKDICPHAPSLGWDSLKSCNKPEEFEWALWCWPCLVAWYLPGPVVIRAHGIVSGKVGLHFKYRVNVLAGEVWSQEARTCSMGARRHSNGYILLVSTMWWRTGFLGEPMSVTGSTYRSMDYANEANVCLSPVAAPATINVYAMRE